MNLNTAGLVLQMAFLVGTFHITYHVVDCHLFMVITYHTTDHPMTTEHTTDHGHLFWPVLITSLITTY